ncbi:MAG: polysaccharide deacetylase [Candidatus Omnitrophota bacterium]
MKIKLILIILCVQSIIPLTAITVMDYQPYVAYTSIPPGSVQLILRKFRMNNRPQVLAVDPITLNTRILPAENLNSIEISWPNLCRKFLGSPYCIALSNAESNAKKEQDAGITHFLPTERGINLTIDLCPSRKPLDRNLFRKIISQFEKIEKPVPLAIAVSGRWIQDHTNDLQWLLSLIRQDKIIVDWINHSFSHPYSKNLPLSRNFFLEPGINIDNEILKNEILMIENGITPSIFFRFPGLISDYTIFKRVIAYGLIPVGSDAWLAKNQNAFDGSIVLIHGNGNEPLGIKKFFNLLNAKALDIKKKNWLLFDLHKSLSTGD